MLESCKTARERWGGVSKIIDGWLQERQELIVRYCSLTSLDFENLDPVIISQKIQAFCQLMMDYISAGHFEVYEQLFAEGTAFNDGSVEAVNDIPSKLQQSTQLLLVFNDRYDTTESCVSLIDSLPTELSELGETMEERFGLEDRLIEVLHESHRESSVS